MSDYYQTLDRIIKSETKEEDKPRYCQYFTGGGGTWCTATSVNTCKNCNFFAPTIHGKIEIVAGHVLKIEDLNDRLVKENDRLQTEVEKQRSEIYFLKREISFMTKKIRKMNERVSVLRYLNPEQFYKYFCSSVLMKKKPVTRNYNKISPTFSQEWDEIRFLINPNARR